MTTTIKMEAIDNGRVSLNPEFYRQKSFKSDLNADRVGNQQTLSKGHSKRST